MNKFREVLKSAKKIVCITGAGISAESGIPTFRGPGAGNSWRNYKASSLATPEAFRSNPSLVWEFYHYRREVAAKAQPNPSHIALAEFEKKHTSKEIIVITQNVDGLHKRAGSKNLLELHGCLYKTRCTKCGEVLVNTDSPICPALANKGAPDKEATSDIPKESLPHCKKSGCGGLLRPHIVWFGETLDITLLAKADAAISVCDICIVVGTTNIVYPAANLSQMAASRGAIVAEFNAVPTGTRTFNFVFDGPCGKSLPMALAD